MRLTSRRDDADVIRARLRVLLAEGRRSGWLPDDDPEEPVAGPLSGVAALRRRGPYDALGDERPEDDRPDPDGPDDPDQDDDEGSPEPGRHRPPARTVRVDPGRRGNWALWVAGLLAALALAGWTWLDRPRVEPAPPATTPAPAAPSVAQGAEPEGAGTPDAGTQGAGTPGAEAPVTVVVSVVGLVVRPGLVTLPEGARVADAVAAAGGLLPEADPSSVNLAALVTDGEQIAVGVPGAAPPAAAAGEGAPAGPLDLNTATVSDLDALPGIGPVLAERIVEHRDRNGRFTGVEQLDDVPGIGPATYAELADLVRV